MSTRAPRKTREQWQSIIATFNARKQDAASFCEQHQLNLSTFQKWQRQFSGLCRPPQSSSQSFVEIKTQETVSRSEAEHLMISCQLPSGLKLEWGHGVSPNYIASLLRALQ